MLSYSSTFRVEQETHLAIFGNILRPCFTPLFIVSLINVDQTIESIAGMPSAQTFPVEF
jgi:hypothetical protein